MTINATENPAVLYLDTDGSPLDAGYIYFGAINQNPETNPIEVYWDAAGTQPVSQPVRTLRGFPVRNGTPAVVYAGSDYSNTVRNRRGEMVTNFPQASLFSFIQKLSTPTGASLVGYHGAIPRTVEQQLDMLYLGIANPEDPIYSSGVTTTQAIQAAIDSGKVVRITSLLTTTASLVLKAETQIVGIGEYDSGIIATGFTYPVFVNDPTSMADFARQNLSSFTIRNGTRAINYTVNALGVQSLGSFNKIRFELQSVRAIECNAAMIANNFNECVFFYCVSGIKTGREANLNNFTNCRFEGLDASSVEFASTASGSVRGGESNRFQGCRFEARNGAAIGANTVLKLDTCEGTVFSNCYFEDTFTNLLTEVGGNGTTKFEHCRYTSANTFVSDAAVTFEGNSFLAGSSGTKNMCLLGENKGLYTLDSNIWQQNSMTVKKATTRNVALTSAVRVDLFKFSSTLAGSADYRPMITGLVSVLVNGRDSGGTPFTFYRTFRMVVWGYATNQPIVTLTAEAVMDNNASGATFSFSATSVGYASNEVAIGLTVACASFGNAATQVDVELTNNFVGGAYPFSVTCLV